MARTGDSNHGSIPAAAPPSLKGSLAGAGVAGTVRCPAARRGGDCPGPVPGRAGSLTGALLPRPPVGSAPNGTTRPGTRSSSHVAHAGRLHYRGCGRNHLLTGGSGSFLVAATCREARICEPAGAPDAMRPPVTSHGYGHLAQRVLTGRQISQRLPASARSRCLRGLAVWRGCGLPVWLICASRTRGRHAKPTAPSRQGVAWA